MKADYNGVGREYKCEVCGKIFIPTPDWVYKSAKTHKVVCSYNCRCKTEKEKTSRYNNLISKDNRR
jgi:hypothetical protein